MNNNNNKITLALLCALTILLSGCIHNPKVTAIEPDPVPLEQIKTPKKPTLSYRKQKKLSRVYLKKFFRPWRLNRRTANRFILDKPVSIKQQQLKTIAEYRKKTTYGENFQAHKPQWIKQLAYQMNLRRYPNQKQRGIITHATALRALPTREPAFSDYHQAGEGFPFDNLQYSSMWPGTPIYVLQLTRNGEWALVVGPTMYGWIEVKDFAYVSANFVKQWQTGNYITIRRDHTPIKDARGYTRIEGRIGMLLPRRDKQNYMPIANTANYAMMKPARLAKNSYVHFPWRFNKKHMQSLIKQINGEPYGWGGMFYFRDCSQLLLDTFSTFGIYLPRNSSLQLQYYSNTDISDKSVKQKKAYLKQQTPYLTLLGLPGHIMLYLGEYQGKPAVFHDIWAIKTKDIFGHKGRGVIGQATVTTLPINVRIAHKDQKNTLLPRITTISHIGKSR